MPQIYSKEQEGPQDFDDLSLLRTAARIHAKRAGERAGERNVDTLRARDISDTCNDLAKKEPGYHQITDIEDPLLREVAEKLGYEIQEVQIGVQGAIDRLDERGDFLISPTGSAGSGAFSFNIKTIHEGVSLERPDNGLLTEREGNISSYSYDNDGRVFILRKKEVAEPQEKAA